MSDINNTDDAIEFSLPFFDVSAEINGITYRRHVEDMPLPSIKFLMAYGYRQYLQDSVAMSKEEQSEILDESGSEGLAEAKMDRVESRLAKIDQGTCSERSVTRDPLEAEIKRVALVALKALAKAQQKKLPKDQKARNAMLAKFIQANRERFEVTAKENLAQQRAAAEEIDDSALDM
jgi:hypothetical protein